MVLHFYLQGYTFTVYPDYNIYNHHCSLTFWRSCNLFTLLGPWIEGHHWLPKLLDVCNSGCKDLILSWNRTRKTARSHECLQTPNNFNKNSEIPSFGSVLRTSSCLQRVKSPGRSGWHRFAWREITVVSHNPLKSWYGTQFTTTKVYQIHCPRLLIWSLNMHWERWNNQNSNAIKCPWSTAF